MDLERKQNKQPYYFSVLLSLYCSTYIVGFLLRSSALVAFCLASLGTLWGKHSPHSSLSMVPGTRKRLNGCRLHQTFKNCTLKTEEKGCLVFIFSQFPWELDVHAMFPPCCFRWKCLYIAFRLFIRIIYAYFYPFILMLTCPPVLSPPPQCLLPAWAQLYPLP